MMNKKPRETMTKTLGKFLQNKRKQAELTQKQVSLHMGYTTAQFVSNWERGLIQPPMETLAELCDLYNINSDEVLGFLVADLKDRFYAHF